MTRYRRPTLVIGIFILFSILALFILAITGPHVGNIMPQVANSLSYNAGGMLAATQPAFNAADVLTLPDGQPADVDRVILKNATLTITVSNPAVKISEITTMAESMGGWVVTSNTQSSTNSAGEDTTYGSITVRVPEDRLNEAMERIKSGTEAVDGESINGQDVTQEYVDLSSRLTNLQASERQLLSIMETARKVEDVLAVQHELTTVRGEIEAIQGRLNFFDEAASFSSIQVNVRPPQPGPVAAQSAGWNPGETVENALGSLIRLLQFGVDAVITLVILVGPLALIIGVPVWLILRRRRQAHQA